MKLLPHKDTYQGTKIRICCSEAINSFPLFDILKLWEVVHLRWEAVPER
jgi:hypothetical protein